MRIAIFDDWVTDFLYDNPRGTLCEIGAGLNTRFERVDNGQVHWLDLDLPGHDGAVSRGASSRA